MSSSDPGLTWVTDARGRLRLGGVASGRDGDGEGAEISLSFDGARVSACVQPGTTAAQAVELLEKALPEGYRLSVSSVRPGEVGVELIRSPNAPRPPQSPRPEDPAIPMPDACNG